MIDQYITKMQTTIALKSTSYFCNKKSQGSKLAYGAYVVVPIVIGLVGALDHIKLILACIEEIVKGVFLIPTSFFSPRLSRRVVRHLKDAKNYALQCFKKLFYGAPTDLRDIDQSYKNPFKDHHSLFSFYGINAVNGSEWERLHPSICTFSQTKA